MKEKVSVIISTHNNEDCVGRMMYSLMNSTYTNIEILCFDNNSNDKTVEILSEFEKEDERVTVFKNCDWDMQTKVQKTTGEYVMFVDISDELVFDGIANMMNAFDSEVDVVASGIRYDNNKGELSFATPNGNVIGNISNINVFRALCNLNNNGKCVAYARIYRKSILTNVDNFSNEYELLTYSTKCMEKANNVALLNLITYKYAPYPSKKNNIANELECAKQTTNYFINASEKYFSENVGIKALAGAFVLTVLFALAGSSKELLSQGLKDEMVLESVMELSNQNESFNQLRDAIQTNNATIFEQNAFEFAEPNNVAMARYISIALTASHSGGGGGNN